jgi:hypothetical protein
MMGRGSIRRFCRKAHAPVILGGPGSAERAKRIGANLKVWSETGAGTEVEVTLPAQIAYGTEQRRTRLRLFRKSKVES